jgi:hypothetical protein
VSYLGASGAEVGVAQAAQAGPGIPGVSGQRGSLLLHAPALPGTPWSLPELKFRLSGLGEGA